MALPQLPAHVVHKLGQQRVIQEFLSTSEYAKRADLKGRLSFVHTVYPIFKVHSSDFFSNIFFFQRPLTRGEEIPQSALFVRVIKQLSTANTILRPSSATSALQMLFFVYCSRMIFGCFFPKKHFS